MADRVKIGIEVDNRSARRDYNKFTSDVEKGQRATRSEFKKTQAAASGLGTGFKSLIAAAGGLFIFSKINSTISESVKLAGEQAAAEAKVAQTIMSTGSAAGLTTDELKKMATELQSVTLFGDEVTLRGQSMLLTFKNIGKDIFPQATEAMLNLSTAMGTDVKESAIQLGKALNDPITGLTAMARVGITFSKEQKNIIKNFQKSGDIASAQKVILSELESQFGGLARAVATTGEGPLIQFQNQIGDVKEELGFAFLPVLTDATAGMSEFFKKSQEAGTLQSTFQGLANGARVFFAVIADTFKGLKSIFELTSGLLNQVVGDFFSFLALAPDGISKLLNILPDKFIPDGWKESVEGFKNELEILAKAGYDSGEALIEDARQTVSGGSSIIAAFKKIASGAKEARKEIAAPGGFVVGEGTGDSTDEKAEAAASKKAAALAKAEAAERQRRQKELQTYIDSEVKKFDEALVIQEEFRRESLGKDEIELLEYQDTLKEKNLLLREAGLEEIDIVSKVIKKREKLEKVAMQNRVTANLGYTQQIIGNLAETLGAFKKFALAEKALVLSQAVINGILGVQKALGSAPPPINFALAATVGAAAAANVYKISNQKFALGGIASGQRSGDKNSIMVNGGERILTDPQNRYLMRKIDSIGNGGISIGNITIQAGDGSDTASIVNAITKTLPEKLREFSNNMKRSNSLQLRTV